MDDLKLWIIIAQIINFTILFLIFKKFLWDKIVKSIEERRKKIIELNQAEEEIKIKKEKAEEEKEQIIIKAREKWLIIEKDATTLAKKNREKIIAEAEIQAESIKTWAMNDIKKERLSMVNSIKKEVINLSLILNEKLFDKEKVNKDFMEKELNSINN